MDLQAGTKTQLKLSIFVNVDSMLSTCNKSILGIHTIGSKQLATL